MPPCLEGHEPRILVQSQRALNKHVANCCLYEFEDVICGMERAWLFQPSRSYDLAKSIFRKTLALTRSRALANFLRPEPNATTLEQDHDLFFVIVPEKRDLFSVNAIRNWRKRCKKAVCYLVEIWERSIPKSKHILRFLEDFDHIFLGVNHATEAVARATGRPCSYLPPAVDAIRFCPFPVVPPRHVDVCYLGRRSPVTHQALLEMAERGSIHYFYDTAQGATFHVNEPSEHRRLLANLLRRSRFFFANRANIDEPDKTLGQQEIGYRFLEGIASGTILLGVPPRTPVFGKYFDWVDAVIEVPFDSANIGAMLADLDGQPERLAQARTSNVVNALLRHDWSQRWRTILETAGLPATPGLLAREARLQQLEKGVRTLF